MAEVEGEENQEEKEWLREREKGMKGREFICARSKSLLLSTLPHFSLPK